MSLEELKKELNDKYERIEELKHQMDISIDKEERKQLKKQINDLKRNVKESKKEIKKEIKILKFCAKIEEKIARQRENALSSKNDIFLKVIIILSLPCLFFTFFFLIIGERIMFYIMALITGVLIICLKIYNYKK